MCLWRIERIARTQLYHNDSCMNTAWLVLKLIRIVNWTLSYALLNNWSVKLVKYDWVPMFDGGGAHWCFRCAIKILCMSTAWLLVSPLRVVYWALYCAFLRTWSIKLVKYDWVLMFDGACAHWCIPCAKTKHCRLNMTGGRSKYSSQLKRFWDTSTYIFYRIGEIYYLCWCCGHLGFPNPSK